MKGEGSAWNAMHERCRIRGERMCAPSMTTSSCSPLASRHAALIAAANSAYDNFSKVTKQATEIAEANVAAATETVKGLAKAKKVA